MQLLSKRYKTSVFGCVFWITTSRSLVGGYQHYGKAADFSIKVAKLEDNNPELNVHGSVHCKNILIYIQQDATLHSLFYQETAVHVSGGPTTHHQERKQLSTASGICHTVTATCRYSGR
jgi:hypothetical protein